MNKHTPGPWNVSDKVCRLGDDRYLVVNSSERWVSLLLEGPQSEDDARLIAAAPELLEALKGINIITSPGNRTMDEMNRDMSYACDRARAAIAKAEGR